MERTNPMKVLFSVCYIYMFYKIKHFLGQRYLVLPKIICESQILMKNLTQTTNCLVYSKFLKDIQVNK